MFGVLIILTIMCAPPLFLWYLGNSQKEDGNKEKAKIYYIIAAIYLVIGLGTCGLFISSFNTL